MIGFYPIYLITTNTMHVRTIRRKENDPLMESQEQMLLSPRLSSLSYTSVRSPSQGSNLSVGSSASMMSVSHNLHREGLHYLLQHFDDRLHQAEEMELDGGCRLILNVRCLCLNCLREIWTPPPCGVVFLILSAFSMFDPHCITRIQLRHGAHCSPIEGNENKLLADAHLLYLMYGGIFLTDPFQTAWSQGMSPTPFSKLELLSRFVPPEIKLFPADISQLFGTPAGAKRLKSEDIRAFKKVIATSLANALAPYKPNLTRDQAHMVASQVYSLYPHVLDAIGQVCIFCTNSLSNSSQIWNDLKNIHSLYRLHGIIPEHAPLLCFPNWPWVLMHYSTLADIIALGSLHYCITKLNIQFLSFFTLWSCIGGSYM